MSEIQTDEAREDDGLDTLFAIVLPGPIRDALDEYFGALTRDDDESVAAQAVVAENAGTQGFAEALGEWAGFLHARSQAVEWVNVEYARRLLDLATAIDVDLDNVATNPSKTDNLV